MEIIARTKATDPLLLLAIAILVTFSTVILYSIAPFIFPTYFFYIAFGLIVFWFVSKIDFEVLSLFSAHFYIGSILFLLLPLVIGQVTRGAVRWINFGPLSIQPAEIVRPFLFIFFANYLTMKGVGARQLVQSGFLAAIPLLLILVQPSLSVAAVTAVGLLGILLASELNKKYIASALIFVAVATPIIFNLLAPYQQQRILTFLSPASDPYGAGYNSIQSVISIGSGKLFGRGLGRGSQTQLAFLPEKHTDFIFASTAEELGFVGAGLLLAACFFLLFRVVAALDKPANPAARAFLAAVSLSLLTQILVNIGMNLGIAPITGLPLPLVSAGGSSLLATLTALAMVNGARR